MTRTQNITQELTSRPVNKIARPTHDVIWGWHAVCAALQNAQRICQHLIITKKMHVRLIAHLRSSMQQHRALHEICTQKAHFVDAITHEVPDGAVHQGIVLYAHQLPIATVEQSIQQMHTQSRWIALDHVTDPQNVGAIFRLAAAFKVQGIIMTRTHHPRFDGVVAKAASGGVEHVPVVMVGNLAQTLRFFQKHGICVMGLAEQSEQTLHHFQHDGPLILVMGQEGAGLRPLSKKTCDACVSIATSPHFPTLNVVTATAIALHHVTAKI